MQVNFPVYVRAKDCGDFLEKVQSIQALQFEVEQIDVENEEYEAWDRDGYPVVLKVREPAWLFMETSTELKTREPEWLVLETQPERCNSDGLRDAIKSFAKLWDVELPDPLPISGFEAAVGLIRNEQEKKRLARSPIRRLFARFRRQDRTQP